MSNQDLVLNFASADGSYTVTFEDNGKVAYAYLKKDGIITSAVWLYNRCATPDIAEWSDRRNIPFANCEGYMTPEGRILEPIGSQDVLVDWDYENGMPVAYICIFEDLCGVLDSQSRVGFARFAAKNSPIAQVMEIAEDA